METIFFLSDLVAEGPGFGWPRCFCLPPITLEKAVGGRDGNEWKKQKIRFREPQNLTN